MEIRKNNWTNYRIVTKQKSNSSRPRQKLKERVGKDLKELGIEIGVEMAKEQNRWRQIVIVVMRFNGLKNG